MEIPVGAVPRTPRSTINLVSVAVKRYQKALRTGVAPATTQVGAMDGRRVGDWAWARALLHAKYLIIWCVSTVCVGFPFWRALVVLQMQRQQHTAADVDTPTRKHSRPAPFSHRRATTCRRGSPALAIRAPKNVIRRFPSGFTTVVLSISCRP